MISKADRRKAVEDWSFKEKPKKRSKHIILEADWSAGAIIDEDPYFYGLTDPKDDQQEMPSLKEIEEAEAFLKALNSL